MTESSEKKVIILHNFTRDDYLKLTKAIDSLGFSNKTIVAVTTATTLDWKLRNLIGELFLEDEEIKKQKKKIEQQS